MGNPFAQGLHDGVTLGNHKGYESFGIDVMDPDWDRNLPICVGFARKPNARMVCSTAQMQLSPNCSTMCAKSGPGLN